jgi:MFS family permease
MMEARYPPFFSDKSSQVLPGPATVTAFMAAAYAVNFMNQGIVLVVAEQIKVDFALTNAQLGLVLGMSYMLLSALGALPLGRIADIYSRSLVVGLSLAFMGVATALTSVVQSFWSMIALRAMAGIGDAGVLPGAVSMISDRVPVERRHFALSVLNAGAAVGALFAYICMGFMAERHGWRTAYFWVGVFGIVVGLAVKLALPDRQNPPPAPNSVNWMRATTELLRIAPYRQIVLAFIASGMTSTATWNWIAPVMQRTYGFNVAEAGTLLGLGAGLGTLLGSLFFGTLASRLRRRNTTAPLWAAVLMQLCVAVCFISGLSFNEALIMMPLMAAGYFFAGAGMVVVLSTIQEAAPTDSRGLAIGLAVLLFSLLGQGLGPLVTGLATDNFTEVYGKDALRLSMQLAMLIGTAWICTHLILVIRACKRASRH